MKLQSLMRVILDKSNFDWFHKINMRVSILMIYKHIFKTLFHKSNKYSVIETDLLNNINLNYSKLFY